jgi:hypothetical protein
MEKLAKVWETTKWGKKKRKNKNHWQKIKAMA